MSVARLACRGLCAAAVLSLGLSGCVSTGLGGPGQGTKPGVVLPSAPPAAQQGQNPPAQAQQNQNAPPIVIPPPVTPPPVAQNYPRTILDSNAGAAVLSLYKKAQDDRAAGHPDQAEALLERAQRIAPHNPFIWQALAGTKLDLGKSDQAEQFANRANDLARGNPYIEAGNWRIIATARQARGDAGGAMQAQTRADDIARALAAN